MSYILEGTVHSIGEVQNISEKFSKQEMVVKVPQEYNNEIPIEWVNQKCNTIRTIMAGDKVRITFDIEGRYWDKGDRYFVSLKGQDCELLSQPTVQAPLDFSEENEDDIPF